MHSVDDRIAIQKCVARCPFPSLSRHLGARLRVLNNRGRRLRSLLGEVENWRWRESQARSGVCGLLAGWLVGALNQLGWRWAEDQSVLICSCPAAAATGGIGAVLVHMPSVVGRPHGYSNFDFYEKYRLTWRTTDCPTG